MIENYKPNKCRYRCIAILLVLVLSVHLLAGCGKNTYKDGGATGGKSRSDNTPLQNEETITDEAAKTASEDDGSKAEPSKQNAADNASDDEQSQKEDATDLLAVTLGQLEEEVQNGNMEEAALLTESLTKGLKQMSKEAEEITDYTKLCKELSSETESLLEQRIGDFKTELSVKQEKAEELIKAIEESLSTGDTDKTIKLIGEARRFFGLAEETHTYGAELTNKAPIYTAAEEKLYDTGLYDTERSEAELCGTGLISDDNKLTACTGITELSEEMKTLADTLETPLEIYNYIKNNIGYAYYYGSRKGAMGTYDSMEGLICIF